MICSNYIVFVFYVIVDNEKMRTLIWRNLCNKDKKITPHLRNSFFFCFIVERKNSFILVKCINRKLELQNI